MIRIIRNLKNWVRGIIGLPLCCQRTLVLRAKPRTGESVSPGNLLGAETLGLYPRPPIESEMLEQALETVFTSLP